IVGIHHIRTTAYHPQTNGLVERFHRTLKTMLRMYLDLDGPGNTWDEYVPEVCLAHNTAIHDRIGKSPFELMYGVEARIPFETLIPSEGDRPSSATAEQMRIYERLRVLHLIARDGILKGQLRQKENYDRRRRALLLDPGDIVAIRRPRMVRHLPLSLQRL